MCATEPICSWNAEPARIAAYSMPPDSHAGIIAIAGTRRSRSSAPISIAGSVAAARGSSGPSRHPQIARTGCATNMNGADWSGDCATVEPAALYPHIVDTVRLLGGIDAQRLRRQLVSVIQTPSATTAARNTSIKVSAKLIPQRASTGSGTRRRAPELHRAARATRSRTHRRAGSPGTPWGGWPQRHVQRQQPAPRHSRR